MDHSFANQNCPGASYVHQYLLDFNHIGFMCHLHTAGLCNIHMSWSFVESACGVLFTLNALRPSRNFNMMLLGQCFPSILFTVTVRMHQSHAQCSTSKPDLSARDASNPESLTSGPTWGWVYHPSHPSNWQRKMRTGPLAGSGKTESRVRCVEACYDHLVKQTCMFQVDLPRGWARQDCASENCNHALHRVWTSVKPRKNLPCCVDRRVEVDACPLSAATQTGRSALHFHWTHCGWATRGWGKKSHDWNKFARFSCSGRLTPTLKSKNHSFKYFSIDNDSLWTRFLCLPASSCDLSHFQVLRMRVACNFPFATMTSPRKAGANDPRCLVRSNWSIAFVATWTSTEWLTDRLTDWVSEWVSEWVTDWLADQLTDWVSEWRNGWMKERTNKPTKAEVCSDKNLIHQS